MTELYHDEPLISIRGRRQVRVGRLIASTCLYTAYSRTRGSDAWADHFGKMKLLHSGSEGPDTFSTDADPAKNLRRFGGHFTVRALKWPQMYLFFENA